MILKSGRSRVGMGWDGVGRGGFWWLVRVAMQTIARNALKQETEDDLYIPDTVDVNDSKAADAKKMGCC